MAGTFHITPSTRIVVQPGDWNALRGTALTFSQDLRDELGRQLPVVAGQAAPGDVYLALYSDGQLGTEGYSLDVAANVSIDAPTPDGVFYATQTIEQMLKADPSRDRLPHGSTRDWPDQSVRAQLIDVGRKFFPVSYLKSQIRSMAWEKLNTLNLHFSEWEGFRIQVPGFPGLASAQSYSATDIRDLEEYAQRYHVTIIPEVDLPSHVTAITNYDHSLGFSCPSLSYSSYTGGNTGGWTLDITSPHTLAFVHELLDEIIPMFNSPVFHVGGDEYQLDAQKAACPELVAYQHARGFADPGDVFVDFMNTLNRQVRSYGKTMEMYGWWQFGGQETSISPDKTIIIDSSGPAIPGLLSAGYRVESIDLADLYITPGLGQKLGDYGYFDVQNVYDNVSFPQLAGLLGYRVSRWSDNAEQQSPAWFDFFARRPLQVFAERTWGGPRAASVWDVFGKADGIGQPPPNELAALAKSDERIISVDSQETSQENGAVANVLDNDPYTIWESSLSPSAAPMPHQITIDLGKTQNVAGLSYLPRQDGSTRGRVSGYEVFVSLNGIQWTLASSGTFADDQTEKTALFSPSQVRFVKFVATSSTTGGTSASAAEISVLVAPHDGRAE